MLKLLLGKKIGMTQFFDENKKSIPVTAIDMSGWFVTQIKTKDTDGYSALQLGLPRNRYRNMAFSPIWLKNKSKFFVHIKEILVDKNTVDYTLGQQIGLKDFAITMDDSVHVAGKSRGLGFQGVVKRWGFSGGPGAHGSTFHRIPGSIGNMCSQGKVIKGRKLPGHCGCRRVMIKNLEVAKVDQDLNCLFVKGAVPGKKNTLLFIKRHSLESKKS